MFLYERLRIKTSSAVPPLGSALDNWIVPLASLGGVGAAWGASKDPNSSFLGTVIPQALTAGSLIGGATYLMGRKPYGLPIATGPRALGDITERFFEGGTAGAMAGIPTYFASRALGGRRQQEQPQQ